MKPNWTDAPAWANFLAMNENDTWTWFAEEPTQNDDKWLATGQTMVCNLNDLWRHTKETRPI